MKDILKKVFHNKLVILLLSLIKGKKSTIKDGAFSKISLFFHRREQYTDLKEHNGNKIMAEYYSMLEYSILWKHTSLIC